MSRIIVILCLLILNNQLFCELNKESKANKSYIGITLSNSYAILGEDFNEIYKNFINKNYQSKISPKFTFGINYKYEFDNHLRIGLISDFYKNQYFDDFFEVVQTMNGFIKKNYSGNFNLLAIPILFSIDYIPFHLQFRSYLGYSFGITYMAIQWNEYVNPQIEGDKRIGGNLYSNKNVNLTNKFYFGSEFGFDKNKYSKFLQCIFIEVFAYYFYNYESIFNKVGEQINYNLNKQIFDNSYKVLPSYFGITLGILFNTKGK